MTMLVHRTRSARVTITPPFGESLGSGRAIIVENLQFNEGFELSFSCRRTMTPELGEMDVSIYNLPADLRGDLEASQTRKPDDLDQILASNGVAKGWTVYQSGMSTDGSDALAVGLPLVRLEAGYDGTVSDLFEAVGARLVSERDDETTYVTRINAVEALDAALYAKPVTVFPAGSPTFDVMTFLRIACGLGQGNATADVWSSIVGASTIDAAYYSTMGGFEALGQLLDFLPLRWWVDGRELWILPKDGQPYPPGVPPPYLPGAPIDPGIFLERPQRIEGGFVEVRTLLNPEYLPGRLMLLSPLSLGLEGATAEQIERADIPPGYYRIEEVAHEGTTAAGGSFDSTCRIKRVDLV